MTDETLPPRPLLDEIALARLDDDFIGFWANGIRNNTDPILKGRVVISGSMIRCGMIRR